MGRSLGKFGKKKAEREDTFDYFEETLRVHPHLSDVAFFDFMRRAKQLDIRIEDPEDREEMAAAFQKAAPLVEDFLTFAIHPDDVDAFFRIARENGQHMLDMAADCQGICAAVAARPTGKSSGSRAGRQVTKQSSVGNSSSRATKRRLEREGRPDFALIVLENMEAQSQRSA